MRESYRDRLWDLLLSRYGRAPMAAPRYVDRRQGQPRVVTSRKRSIVTPSSSPAHGRLVRGPQTVWQSTGRSEGIKGFLTRLNQSMGDLLGYARASSVDRDASLQLDALKAAGCVKVFTDKPRGSSTAGSNLTGSSISYVPATPSLSGGSTAWEGRSSTSSPTQRTSRSARWA